MPYDLLGIPVGLLAGVIMIVCQCVATARMESALLAEAEDD